jgi:two-component system response regulator HydG
MSAQLSSTASESIGSRKKAIESSPRLRDSLSNIDKHHHLTQIHEGIALATTLAAADCPTPSQPLRMLVVDESRSVRKMCCEVAESFGFAGTEAESISAARKLLKRRDTAILVLDLTQQEGGDRALLAEMKSICPDALVIGTSASATIASAVEIMRAGAFDYLAKPFTLDLLARTVDRANKRLCFDSERRKLRAAMSSASGMMETLGQSAQMEHLYQILSKVADSRHPVMILGESGTGKEHVARSIHSTSRDGSRPFISVDCRSMSSISLQRLLFGELWKTADKMSSSRQGVLSAPDGGTVFLNEIGNLTLDMQARLARVIKEKRISSPDGMRTDQLSVRILAATSCDLAQMLKDGSFRMDLYCSLSLVNLKIPPLRRRPEDIAFLAQRFLEKIGRLTGVVRTLSEETLQVLETYDWPENTRELETAITQACTSSPGPQLEVDHLPQNILTFVRSTVAKQTGTSTSLMKLRSNSSKENVITIANVEKHAILTVLKQTNNDKRIAAKLLGIGKTTLYRRLKEYEACAEPVSASPPGSSADSIAAFNVSDLPSPGLICA